MSCIGEVEVQGGQIPPWYGGLCGGGCIGRDGEQCLGLTGVNTRFK